MALVPTGGGASFDNVCKAIFGDVFDVDVAKGSPDQADVNGGGSKPKGRTAAENIALATNAGGVVAGPGALYAAYKGAKSNTGGFPRDLASEVGRRRDAKRGGKPGRLTRSVRVLNEKAGRKGRIGAGLAGATMVGLQAANMTGDAIATHTFAGKGKSDVDKADHEARHGRAARAGQHRSYSPLSTPAGQAGQDIKRFAKTPAGKIGIGTIGAYGLIKTGGSRSQPSFDPYVYGKSEEGIAVGEFSKFDDDKRLAFGWASVVELGGMPVIDKQGDYITIDDLEEAAYTYVHKSRVGGDMHKRNGADPHHVSDMVESIVFTDDKIAKMGLPDDFPRGWWVGFKVHDDETWDLVRKQGRTGFSIHGKGMRKDVPLDEIMGY